jgi:hypothetical protein
MRFIGIFQDGAYIDRPKLENITATPRIKYILKIDEFINYSGYAQQKSYELINSVDRRYILKIGGFELLDIGTVLYDSSDRTHYVDATVYEFRVENHISLN